MAYVAPIIRLRENGHRIIRGGWWDSCSGRSVFQATETEVFNLKVIATDILDGATITASAEADGVTATPTVATGTVTLACSDVSDMGDIDLTLTFSDGRVQLEYIRICDPSAAWVDDYGLVRVQ